MPASLSSPYSIGPIRLPQKRDGGLFSVNFVKIGQYLRPPKLS